MDKVQGMIEDWDIIRELGGLIEHPYSKGARSKVGLRMGLPAGRVFGVSNRYRDDIMELWVCNRTKREPVLSIPKETWELITKLKAIAESRVYREKDGDEHYLTSEMVEDQRRREKEMLEKAVETATKLKELTYNQA